jgi:hypothetical protein
LANDRENDPVRCERIDRGWIFLQRCARRPALRWWNIFIDVVALTCVVFSVAGLLLLQTAARQRKSMRSFVGGGVALATALLLLFH